jgi:phospholipid transport system substrate-binding protein
MKRQLYSFVLFVIVALFNLSAAATIMPDALIKQTTNKLLSELTSKRKVLMKDTSELYRLVDELVLPHFDFRRMSQLVLGKYWRTANNDQREQFVEHFRNLLVRTYATALFEYTGQKIVYKPFRLKQGATRAVVKTEILQHEGPKIPFHYSLKLTESGAWKIFDIRVDGISLVTNYRTSYSQMIKNSGIDSLISSLADKNRTLAQ